MIVNPPNNPIADIRMDRKTVMEKVRTIEWMHFLSPDGNAMVDRRLFATMDELAMFANAGLESATYLIKAGMWEGEQEVFVTEPIKATYYMLLLDGQVFISKTPFTMEPLKSECITEKDPFA